MLVHRHWDIGTFVDIPFEIFSIFSIFFKCFHYYSQLYKLDLYIRILCYTTMIHLSFGTNFGIREQLAADIWVMLYVHTFKFSTIFLFFSNVLILIFMNMQIR